MYIHLDNTERGDRDPGVEQELPPHPLHSATVVYSLENKDR